MRQAVPATTASGGSGRRYYPGTIRFARIRIQRMLNFDKACQTMRTIRERTDLATGKTTTETVYALTSVSAKQQRRPRTTPRLESGPFIGEGAVVLGW